MANSPCFVGIPAIHCTCSGIRHQYSRILVTRAPVMEQCCHDFTNVKTLQELLSFSKKENNNDSYNLKMNEFFNLICIEVTK